jgi:hypothetical protein
MMLALVVVAIMLGFPTAFTLMGMGMIFTWFAYEENTTKTLTLMVQSAFKVMGNDVLISHPAVRLHGLPGRARQPDRKAVQELAPGHGAGARFSLAVATLFTCAVFATATGIVGAVVTLDGAAGAAADAARRLRRAGVGGRHHRRRLPGHPDPAQRDADRLRRHGRRLGGSALRRRVLSPA